MSSTSSVSVDFVGVGVVKDDFSNVSSVIVGKCGAPVDVLGSGVAALVDV